MDNQVASDREQTPPLTEYEQKVRDERKLADAKQFNNGIKYLLLVQMRLLKQQMQSVGMHYGEPCSDKEVGYDNSHNFHDLGDPCYCGSDNCGICLDCGEENHD